MPSVPKQPTVVALMSTYNGVAFLDEQLASIFNQSGVTVQVVVRDDGSVDGTSQLLDRWSSSARLSWTAANNVGPAASFMELVAQAPAAEYYAFADQDDSWDPDKLSAAINRLADAPPGSPALYFSEKRPVDRELNPIRVPNPVPPRRTFGSALILSAGSGCTMVFNQALLELLRQQIYLTPRMHDHWVYKVCSAVGGAIFYDPMPHIAYRQHGSNVVSADESVKKRLRDWFHRVDSKERAGDREAGELLARYGALMPSENRQLVELVVRSRESCRNKWRLLRDPRFHTGRRLSDAAFKVAVFLDSF